VTGQAHTDAAADTVESDLRCGHCGTSTAMLRQGQRWCGTCHIWLVRDHTGTEWVSYAEREHRQHATETARRIADATGVVTRTLPRLQALVPPGWQVTVHQPSSAIPTIAVDPPPGTVDATAYLQPADGDRGWYVRIHNRARRIDFPLYTAGGAHAAYFATTAKALHAARTALAIEMVDAGHR